MQTATCSARLLAADPDAVAPVSGCRCRQCGANARRRPPEEAWTVYNRAAYCPECCARLAEEAEQLAARRVAELGAPPPVPAPQPQQLDLFA